MRKWLLLLCLLLLVDARLLAGLGSKTSLDVLREAGIPEESFQAAGISREDALLYIGFWRIWNFFLWLFLMKGKKSFLLKTGGMTKEAMAENGSMKAAISLEAGN